MSLVLNDPMLFETLIAYSKIALRHQVEPQHRLTIDVRFHLVNIVKQLRSRLATCARESHEAMILTIYYLLVIHQAAGEHAMVDTHLGGLKRLEHTTKVERTHCSADFLAVRIRSAELVEHFLVDEAQHLSRRPTHESDSRLAVPPDFYQLVLKGRVTQRGIDFLLNIDKYMGRAYVPATKDSLATLLALRMVESMQRTGPPAHALITETFNHQGAHLYQGRVP